MIILVVDTVPLVLRNMDRLLSAHGHEVIAADSGENALEILKRDHRIRLVITDLLVGGMTAVDLFKSNMQIERISDDGNSSPPEFILLTRLTTESQLQGKDMHLLQEAIDLGFVDVLFKPLVREELLRHVRQIDTDDPWSPPPEPARNSQKSNSAASRVTDHLQQLEERHADFEANLGEIRETLSTFQADFAHSKKWMRLLISEG